MCCSDVVKRIQVGATREALDVSRLNPSTPRRDPPEARTPSHTYAHISTCSHADAQAECPNEDKVK